MGDSAAAFQSIISRRITYLETETEDSQRSGSTTGTTFLSKEREDYISYAYAVELNMIDCCEITRERIFDHMFQSFA